MKKACITTLHVLTAAAVMALTGAVWAAPTWIGASGNWSDAANWACGVLPTATDVVRVSNTVANVTINIDLPSVTVKEIHFEGHTAEGVVTVTGGKLVLTSSDYTMVEVKDSTGTVTDWNTRHWDRSSAAIVAYPYGVDFHVPVEFSSTGTAGIMGTYGDIHFHESVTGPEVTSFRTHNGIHKDQLGYVSSDRNSALFLHGSFSMPKANVTPQQSPTGGFYVCGPTFEVYSMVLGNYISPDIRLMSTNTVIHSGLVTPLFAAQFQSELAGTYPTNTVVEFRKGGGATGTQALFDLGLVDRTLDRLSSASPLDTTDSSGYVIRSRASRPYGSHYYGSAPTTLTLRGTGNALTEGKIMDDITVVWDPVDDFTQTLSNRTHTTTGSFVVKRGTLKLAGKGSIASARALEIASGATFELASSLSDPLPRDLIVTSTSHLRLNGATVHVKRLVLNGVAQADGTYAGATWMEGSGSVVVAAGSCRTWINTSGGNWFDAANWLGGNVPSSTSDIAILDAQTVEDIVIAINADIAASSCPGLLEIVNRGTGTTTLRVAAAVTDNDGVVRVGRHARVEVPAGGRFHYETKTSLGTWDSAWHDKDILSVVDGGQWLTCGGEVVYTNVCGQCWVNGEGSKLVISAGQHTYTAYGSDYPLSIGSGAKLELTGGTLYQPHDGANQKGDLTLFGGTADFSGGTYRSDVLCTSGSAYGVDFGSGTFILRGTARTFMAGAAYMRPIFSFTHLDWIIRDDAILSDQSYLIGGRRFGDATVRICGTPSGSGSEEACGNWYLGAFQWNWNMEGTDAGDGQLIVTSGNTLFAGYSGVFVAGGQTSVPNAAAPTPLYQKGYLRVEPNAALNVNASALQSVAADRPTGICVGMAARMNVKSGHPCVGRVEIEGDVTNRLNLVVGGWFGRGTYVQKAGHTLTAAETGFDHGLTAVGLGGGEGALLVSNGCFSTRQSVWVGGCLADEFVVVNGGERVANKYASVGGWPIDDHSARGVLEVSDGQFATSKSLYVGVDGTGVVSVVGSKGRFSVDEDLVLSNKTASVLRFTADASGIAPMAIGGKLILTDAASLEVDLNACPNLYRMKLCTATGGVEGSLAAATVTPGTFEVIRRGNSLYAISRNRRGLSVVVR